MRGKKSIQGEKKFLKNWQNVHIRALFCAALLLLLFVFTAGASEKKQVEVQATEIKLNQKPEVKKNLAIFIQYEEEFSKSLVDLRDNLGKLVSPETYQEQILKISEQLDHLDWQVQRAKTDLNMGHDLLAALDMKLVRQEQALEKMDKPLTKDLEKLSDWEVEWSQRKQDLIEWEKAISQESSFALVLENIDSLSKTTVGILAGIRDKLKPAIETGQRISNLQVKAYGLIVDIEVLIGEQKKKGFEQTMPPIFSQEFSRFFNTMIFVTTWEKIKQSFVSLKNVLWDHPVFLICNFLGIILAILSIRRMGHNIGPSDRCYFFTQKSVAVSIFFFLQFYLIFHVVPLESFTNLKQVLQMFVSFVVILLATIFTSYSSGERLLLQLFAFILIVTWFLRILNLPPALMQLYVACISLCMICYCFLRIRDLREKKKKAIQIAGLRLIIVIFTITCGGMIFGYEQFSFYIFTSLLIGIVAAHALALNYLIVNSALELILLRVPSKLIQINRTVIVDRLAPIVGVLTAIAYLLIISVEFQIYPTRKAAAEGLMSMGNTIGGVRIEPDSILLTVGMIYIVLITSKGIQKILMDSIFPRYRMEFGVQLSIQRLIHYFVLVVGFIILLNILGFELTQLTILGGALGVGIGFGLQAIVNNFASGLILLFERPIKVGDTVEIGNEFGEVKKLGLRATIVSTFDNAEIVIPNSDLITTPVTNWTLSGRQARVKVPVGVAYGSDIQKVLEILLTCAKEHPLVLTQPQPRALFLAFGASSLDFELRVWTPDFSDRRQLQSELNQEIESEFSLAGVEIPFPQADLHLRSVDDRVAATLHGDKTQTS